MKIAFLSGGLEQGRDGVGDYTRLLSEECIRQGHLCCRIALNDHWVQEPQQLKASADGIVELRLPTHLPWSQRINHVQRLLEEFAPDWISLQFVPYAFHPKGLPFGLARNLQPLFTGKRSQIMFHELWIGEPANSSWRHRVIGAIQKRLMLQLIRQLEPQIVHTSNDVYVGILARESMMAQRLPIFGNVPVEEKTGDDWLFAEMRSAGVKITTANRAEFWLTGFFGALPPDWSPEPVLTTLLEAADRSHRRLVVLSAGNLVSGETLWQELSQRYSPKIEFLKIGRQPAEKVSQFLNSLDFGLATTAYGRIGKSGSVAAMLDHGLPVIVSQEEEFRAVVVSKGENESLLYRLDHLAECLDAGLKRQKAHTRLPEIAVQFIKDLQKSSIC